MTVQLQKATQYYYYRAAMAIFPLAPDQTIAQMWSNGARGGGLECKCSKFHMTTYHSQTMNMHGMPHPHGSRVPTAPKILHAQYV